MDGFLLHRDYRAGAGAASAAAALSPYGSFPSSYRYQQYPQPRDQQLYGVDRWSSHPLPATGDLSQYSSYLSRPALRGGRRDGPGRGYRRPAQAAGPRNRGGDAGRGGGDAGRPRKRPMPVENLGPRKKTTFKQTQAAKKPTPAESKEKANLEAMAKEIKELHALWRTRGEPNKDSPGKGKPAEQPKGANKKTPEKPKGANKRTPNKEAKPKDDVEMKEDEQPNKEGVKSKRVRRPRKRNPSRKKKWVRKDRVEGKPQEGAESTGKDKDSWSAGEAVPKAEGDKAWGQEGAQNGKTGDTPMTEEEKKQAASVLDLQKKACKSVTEFLGNASDGEDESEDENPVSDAELEGGEKASKVKGREEAAYDFFSKLFDENQELRKVYVDQANSGTFECLVCSATGFKVGKKFRDLVSLVMHASKILRTKKRPEHRGYGRAVCSVLGWDPLRNPVFSKGKDGIRPRGCIPPREDVPNGANCQDKDGLESNIDNKDSEINEDGKKPEDVKVPTVEKDGKDVEDDKKNEGGDEAGDGIQTGQNDEAEDIEEDQGEQGAEDGSDETKKSSTLVGTSVGA